MCDGKITRRWYVWLERIFDGSRSWRAGYSQRCRTWMCELFARTLLTGRSRFWWKNRSSKSRCNVCTGYSFPGASPNATGEGSPARSARRARVKRGSVAELGGFRCLSRGSGLDDVQAALGLGESRPASRARIFSRPDGARAMRAADAGIVLVVQWVVGYVVIVDVAPHLLRSPVDHGINLHEAVLCIPFNSARAGTS